MSYFSKNAQVILSLGYLYLVILGLSYQTLFYSQLGIKIMDYSAIHDVLLSPISLLASNRYYLILTLGSLIFVLVIPYIITKNIHRRFVKKVFNRKGLDKDKVYVQYQLFSIMLFLSFNFGLLVGKGSKNGQRLMEEIKNKKIAYKSKIVFMDNKTDKVYIIGQNSTYLFYLTKDSKQVKATPISGILKSIEKVKN